MAEQYELMMLVLGGGTLALVVAQRAQLKRLSASPGLLLAFACVFAGWVFTVAEDFALPDLLNYLEHAAYAAGALLFGWWCWMRPDLRGVKRQ